MSPLNLELFFLKTLNPSFICPPAPKVFKALNLPNGEQLGKINTP